MKAAVVLFNLGGPQSLEAVEPFLINLFSDRAVIDLPRWLRIPVARLVAKRRAPVARDIYARIGGRSPILEETQAQAKALETELAKRGHEARVFIAMRCAPPQSDAVVKDVKAWSPERVVLLPLYPQFSTTTTRSSLIDWERAAEENGLAVPHSAVCCFPDTDGFIDAMAALVHDMLRRTASGVDYRLLLSAHGLPERTVAKGDPYRWQVERCAKALVEKLGIASLDWRICFQSRVGPLSWIGPATDAEIRRAGSDGKGVVVVPIAFVSEHVETLVELDLDYAKLARESGVRDYLRVPTVGTHPLFIGGLAKLVEQMLERPAGMIAGGTRRCPETFRYCEYREKRG